MKKFNVFLFVHREADCTDPPQVRWITVFAKAQGAVKTPLKWRGWYVSRATVHACGG